MKTIVDDEDLTVHILGQLGDDFASISAALKAWDTSITFPDLFDKLIDHERSLKDTQTTSVIATVNNTQLTSSRYNSRFSQDTRGTNRFLYQGPKSHRSPGQQSGNHFSPRERSAVHTLSEYGGPDKIVVGNGKRLSITHTGHSTLPTSSRPLNLDNILFVPQLRNNLVSVAELCKTNKVSVEFFPFHFVERTLTTSTMLLFVVGI
ncbi:hypothetical protein Tco_0808833 [Tanacetum coccineum]